MQNDYIWLSPSLMHLCDAKYAEAIDDMNSSYDFKFGKVTGKGLKDTESFAESLYMLHAFLKGKLWAPANDEVLMSDYITTSNAILTELCKRGVYTTFGIEPSIATRSCHNFIVLINDVLQEDFVYMLKTLFARGVNVNARQEKAGFVKEQMVYAKDSGSFIYSDTFNASNLSLPNGFHSLGVSDLASYGDLNCSSIDPDFHITGIHSTSFQSFDMKNAEIEKDKTKDYSLYYVETWSQSYDDFRVEDVFLQLWLKFNGDYGSVNNVSW